jgi:curli biogenesis system outer membrane secretion channel CsgG
MLLLACGCASTGESAKKDKLTSDVGRYTPPPQQSSGERPRVGVPPFKVEKNQTKIHNIDSLAADQLTTLIDQTDRFDVVERAQLEQLIDEQNLEGIVKSEEMAKAAQVRGVDYLLYGRVTNFRVKQDQTKSGLNLGGIAGRLPGGGGFGAGQSGYDKKNMSITTECGIDLRLVNPTTGVVAASQFSEYKRTDSANALGITVLGVGTTADAEVTIEEDDAGKILRLACDEALKKMLPKIDRELQKRGSRGSAATRAPARSAVAAPADAGGDDAADATAPAETSAPAGNGAAPAAASKFCGECGTKVAANAKFCPKCGAKIQ